MHACYDWTVESIYVLVFFFSLYLILAFSLCDRLLVYVSKLNSHGDSAVRKEAGDNPQSLQSVVALLSPVMLESDNEILEWTGPSGNAKPMLILQPEFISLELVVALIVCNRFSELTAATICDDRFPIRCFCPKYDS